MIQTALLQIYISVKEKEELLPFVSPDKLIKGRVY